MRYVKATVGFGLFFSNHSTLDLQCFTDSDWGGCPNDRRSINGYAVIWAKILFHGLRRNNQPLPGLPLRVNIGLLLTPLLKLCGFDPFSLNLASLPQIQLHCGVIMWELFIYVQILSFMPEQNISNLTIISFENKSNNTTFRLLIFLPNHLVSVYLLST